MNPAFGEVWKHMLHLGLGALAHANRHAGYAAIENSKWPELSVLQAAHAAELIFKACIAQEHPLLIFEELPRLTQARGATLSLEDLLYRGRTILWNEIPDRLWATTGLEVPNKKRFDQFGRIRNAIQHFGLTHDLAPAEETLRFIFEVVDPFINRCWGLFAIDYDEDYEPYIYFVRALVKHEIEFLVSLDAAESFENWDADWSAVSERYRTEMHSRVEAARKAKAQDHGTT